jgi:hypothetical protein
MKKLFILTLLFSLSGCDLFGNSGHQPKMLEQPPVVEEPPVEIREEMIQRELNLPPEPDETENNATILGVDTNENNIRDDVERQIAFELYENPAEMKRHMRYAQLWTETFLAEGDKDKLKAIEWEKHLNIRCQTIDVTNTDEFYEATDSRYKTANLLGDSRDRYSAYKSAIYFDRDEFRDRAPKEEVRTYCSQFNN